MQTLMRGKPVADQIYQELVDEAKTLSIVPKLSVIIVGEDPASQTYVKSKARKCEALGFVGETISLPANVSKQALTDKINQLNEDTSVHGILVQLPLPSHLNKYDIFSLIEPQKDVDGLHPVNAGLLAQGRARLLPCTPAGILRMLRYYEVELESSHAVVIGRSEIVGKPMAQMLLGANATVTLCHSRTSNLEEHTKQADIVVAAAGKPNFISAKHLKSGAVVVDVGIHRLDGKLVGDVSADQVAGLASKLSPVPGGVGPLTIAMLMRNVLEAAKLNNGVE